MLTPEAASTFGQECRTALVGNDLLGQLLLNQNIDEQAAKKEIIIGKNNTLDNRIERRLDQLHRKAAIGAPDLNLVSHRYGVGGNLFPAT